MTGPVLVALAALTSTACAWVSLRQLHRAATATGADTASLAAALKRIPREDRARALAERAGRATWEHRVATELLEAPELSRLALLNDALGELEHVMTMGESWPRAAARLSLLAGGLLAVLAYLASLHAAAVTILVLGVAGAAASMEAGRRARRAVTMRRGAVDALVHALAGHLEAAPQGLVTATRAARRARR